jgi:hypothetical protein
MGEARRRKLASTYPTKDKPAAKAFTDENYDPPTIIIPEFYDINWGILPPVYV